MRMSTGISRVSWAVAAALALAIGGCGSSGESGSGAAAANKGSPGAKAPNVGRRPPDNMVAAVSAAKGGPPVELKFELRERPRVGQPVDIDIALLPASPNLERVHAVFQAGDGLDLVSGGETAPIEKPQDGVAVHHTIRILPKRDGIFVVSAVVSVDSSNESLSRTFSIPLIAGEGLTELAAKSEVAAGQPPEPRPGAKTR